MTEFSAFNCSGFIYSNHAVKRMIEKQIATNEVELTVSSGMIIKEYRDDKPFPSKLILNFINERPIHVVVSQDMESLKCIIITCYEASSMFWSADFKTKIG